MQTVFQFCHNRLVFSGQTEIMGILNITPDSFSDGGLHFNVESAVQAATEMKQNGAAILDVGAQSTRPGHTPVSPEEEWERLKPVLKSLPELGLPVSVDTFYPQVAEKALAAGCHIINDVSGTVSPEMGAVVQKYGAGWILMHAKAETEEENIVPKVHRWFLKALQTVESYGIARQQICLDPGIGFGKTRAQDLNLLAHTAALKVPGVAYLMAASRKRVIAWADGRETQPSQRDFGTVAAHTVAAMEGADILRVHDCFAAGQAVRVANALKLEKTAKGQNK